MARPDPALMLLKDSGFLPVRLPRADMAPLQLLSKDGKDLNLLGELTNAMTAPAGVQLPPIVADIATANKISGQASSRVKLSIGIDILGGIVGALSGQKLSVGAGFERAKTMTFEFSDVTVDRIDIVLLDQYLNKVDIREEAQHIETLMIDDKIGVISATVKSKKFLVSAQDDTGRNLALDVPVIKSIASGNLEIEAANNSNTQIAYEGTQAVAFGVQAVQLFFDQNGNYTAFNPFKVGEGAVRKEGEPGVPEAFDIEGGFVRVNADSRTRTAN